MSRQMPIKRNPMQIPFVVHVVVILSSLGVFAAGRHIDANG